MGNTTKISWAEATWNPWQGCTKVSPGCKHCYMFRDKKRYGDDPTKVVRSSAKTFEMPLKEKEPTLYFVCSWSDFWHKDADAWRCEAIDIMRKTPQHRYQVLTKRPERMRRWMNAHGQIWPDNVWLGISAENQEQFDIRTPILLREPADVHFISAEPLLGPIDMQAYLMPLSMYKAIDWVITGGESGNGDAWREMDPDWAASIMLQCKEWNVAFHHKQNGGNKKIDGEWGGNMLLGNVIQEMPKAFHRWEFDQKIWNGTDPECYRCMDDGGPCSDCGGNNGS